MLNVKTPGEVLEIIKSEFSPLDNYEYIDISESSGRILAEDILSNEYVPGFDRSSVDGYALIAADSFGCSESIPALLKISESVEMGKNTEMPMKPGMCAQIPTGGKLPLGADAVVMLEYTESLSDDEIAVLRPVAPGENIVYKGDDSKPGQIIAKKGTIIKPQHIGTFASLGIGRIKAAKKLTAGIISTGDELVGINETPLDGQVRDVNSYLIGGICKNSGCEVRNYGFLKDDEKLLRSTVAKAADECDIVIISGGSSVGQKDTTARIIEEYSPLLFHGIAMKPGKPTILGKAGNKPIAGLPGHPGASFFVATLFIKPLIARLYDLSVEEYSVQAILSEAIPANQGREVYIGVSLKKEHGCLIAYPLQAKSGLISTLAKSDGYICVPRDCEGFPKGAVTNVFLFR